MFDDLDGIDPVRIRDRLHLYITENTARDRLIGLRRVGDLGSIGLGVDVAQYDVRDEHDNQEQTAEDTDNIQLFVFHVPTSRQCWDIL